MRRRKVEKYQQDFSFQKQLLFQTNWWKIFKGPILPLGISEIKIKIIKCNLIDTKDKMDSKYFIFGVCTPDFNNHSLAWHKDVWSFGSGSDSGIFQNKTYNKNGQLIGINDEITLKIDLNQHEMGLKINSNDFGVVCTQLPDRVCFAISTRDDLEIELEKLNNHEYFYEFFQKKKIMDLNINFQSTK